MRRIRSLTAVVLGFGLAVACTLQVGTPSVSSSPPDAVPAFLAIVQDPRFSGRYTSTGTFRFGSQPVRVTGHGRFIGHDSVDVSTASLRGQKVTVIDITANGTDYEKVEDGPWVERPVAHVDAILDRLTTAEDLRIETKAGLPLHHLRPPEGFEIIPSDLGLQDEGVSGLEASIDMFAKDDGTPVVIMISAAWTQPEGRVRGTQTYQLSDIGSPVSVAAPTNVWKTFTSLRSGYRISYPSDWSSEKRAGTQLFSAPSGARVGISALSVPPGAGLNQVVRAEIAADLRRFGPLEAHERIVIGGERAHLLTFHSKIYGMQTFVLVAVALHGSQRFGAFWVSRSGSESADRAMFHKFLSTVEFTGQIVL